MKEIKNLKFADLSNKYCCIVNHVSFYAVDCNKKPVLRVCNRFAKKGFQVNLYYVHSNASVVLVKSWND